MKTLFVVRHAEAAHNVLDVMSDTTTAAVHLTDIGIRQAKLLAQELLNIEIDAVYTSELDRTIETAQILIKSRQVLMISDARLNDIRTGLRGVSFDEYRKAMYAADDVWNVRFNDGESYEDEKARTLDFLQSLNATSYENILIVTHGGVANIIYGLAHHLDNDATFNRVIDNASLFTCQLNFLPKN